ncbi:acyl-CoA thioesterase [Lysobacter sp. HDW10]|jgi:acyl-CoA thioester hydrolase|uniref:acyl-CoA thioesterase n=1 Tax=Lysobacter sp. HDW10 TaxID=2714936 RepID=UPI00140B2B72|nr:thioesterase family protein [Lysobacter sp. HDW10]QIK80135.1 acyl-CoA thioesterase [Lysobacter sp. HDW10]
MAFTYPIELRWRDLDAFNHVNNSNYLTFLEEARIRWFATLREPWLTDEFAPVIASALVNYKFPIEYPANVHVELFTAALGTSSVTIGHRIVGDDGRLYCDGQVVAVWISRKTGKPITLPEGVRHASEMLMEPAAS